VKEFYTVNYITINKEIEEETKMERTPMFMDDQN
jgi:hypothetical protein